MDNRVRNFCTLPRMNPLSHIRAACFDWGGTLMSEQGGPDDVPMALWPRVVAIDGAIECVRALSGRLPLAIATNASVSRRSMIERALSRVGLARYFDHIFCFTELGYRKDQVEFWRTVERDLAIPLHAIAMIGGSYEQDVLHPRRFGAQAVWFNHGGRAAHAGAAVPSVEALSTFSAWVMEAAG